MRLLFDDKKRLVIPLQIQGRPGNLTVLPDIQALLKVAAKGSVKSELEKLLGGGKGKDNGLGKILGF